MRSHRRAVCSLFVLFAAGCDCGGGNGLKVVAPKLTLDSQSLDFGDVAVNDLRILGLTLKNEGQLIAHITKFDLTPPMGEFLVDQRPMEIAPGDSVQLILTYAPIDLGEDLGTLVVDADDSLGERTVNLRGKGVQGGIGVTPEGSQCMMTPDSMDFGAVDLHTTADKKIVIQSTGNAAINLLSVTVKAGSSSAFTVDPLPSGGVSVPAGGSYEIKTHFSPTDGGPASGSFIITTDVPDRPSIEVTVCGVGNAPGLCPHPSTVDFGDVANGARATQTLKLESCGTQALVITAVELANDAAHMTNAGYAIDTPPALPATLAPGQSVDVVLGYAAGSLGPANGYLKATANTSTPDTFVPLAANGAQPCTLDVQPTMITFSQVAMGMTADQAVTVANTGATACNVTRVAIATGAPEFSLSATTQAAPYAIPPGGAEIVHVVYGPGSSAGPHMGTLEIDGNGHTTSVALSGNPMLPAGCQLELQPTVLNFGGVAPGTVRTIALNVNNISDDVCTIRGASLDRSSDPAFRYTSAALGIVLPHRSKQLSVTYSPTRQGSARGQLDLTTSDVDTPDFHVPIFASSLPSGICVDPRILPFGPSPGAVTQDFQIYACGANAVTVTGFDWTTADNEFALQSPPAVPFTLQAGQRQTVTVRYNPTDMMGDYAVVTVRSNDPVNPAVNVEMTGGPEVVPTGAGRYMYYWTIPSPIGGDIMRLPLQGVTTASSFWGPRSGKQCAGCHSVSPDGRYVALLEFGASLSPLKIVDTTSNVSITLPSDLARSGVSYFAWRPNVNAQPGYQFAFDAPNRTSGMNTSIHIGSLYGGYIGELAGANDPSWSYKMPTWSSGGTIAFVRGMAQQMTSSGAGGFTGPTDLLSVPEGGGTATAIPGASSNNMANYYPAYSPNGRWLAFTQSASAMGTISASDAMIRMVPASMSGGVMPMNNINATNGASSYPTWAVDGTYMSFSSNRPGGMGDWDIYIAPIDPMTGADSAPSNLSQANTSAFEHAAQWSP
ncbi:MAG: choice-of-anchor D domain-containing protein [Myxococcota bacterium]